MKIVFVAIKEVYNKEKMEHHHENSTDDYIVCYAPTMVTTNGIWQGDNPLAYSLPIFILQLTLVVAATRIFVFILKPLRQPRVIAEIMVSSFLYERSISLFSALSRIDFEF